MWTKSSGQSLQEDISAVECPIICFINMSLKHILWDCSIFNVMRQRFLSGPTFKDLFMDPDYILQYTFDNGIDTAYITVSSVFTRTD